MSTVGHTGVWRHLVPEARVLLYQLLTFIRHGVNPSQAMIDDSWQPSEMVKTLSDS